MNKLIKVSVGGLALSMGQVAFANNDSWTEY